MTVPYVNTQLTEPVLEFVSIARVKRHIAVGHTDDDANIQGMIKAAREYCEAHTYLAFGPRTYLLELPAWPMCECGGIEFPVEPLVSVASLKYLDTDDVEQTVSAADYVVWTRGSPPVLRKKTSYSYPSLSTDAPNPIAITYTAGLAVVPETAVNAALLIIEYWQENPGGESSLGHLSKGIPAGAIRLLETLWTGKL